MMKGPVSDPRTDANGPPSWSAPPSGIVTPLPERCRLRRQVAVAAAPHRPAPSLADKIGGRFELDVESSSAIKRVVGEAAAALGGESGRRRVPPTDGARSPTSGHSRVSTSCTPSRSTHVGANSVLRAPVTLENGVVLIASSRDVGRPRAGVAAYDANQARLDEILHSWRSERPDLSIIRVGMGFHQDTEILRGADRDLLNEMFSRVANGQLPAQMSALADVQHAGLVGHDGLRESHGGAEVVQLAPRIRNV